MTLMFLLNNDKFSLFILFIDKEIVHLSNVSLSVWISSTFSVSAKC